MKEKGNEIGNFDEVLNRLYGEPGTAQREEFRREAYAYCVGAIIHDARKQLRSALTPSSATAPGISNPAR